MGGGVFINYRGADSYSYAALLYAELSRRFGTDLVFLDSESIPPGVDFEAELLGRVRQACVVLAVVGSRWLAAARGDGRRQIDDPADWIRRELVEAFAAGVRVIPVLTDGAGMPAVADLPADIGALGRCQFRRLRRRDSTADLGRLVAELADLDSELGAASAAPRLMDWPMPNQLPAVARYFTGRQEQLALLVRPREDGAARTLVISAVDGLAGIGKTALAVSAAHQLAASGRYPGGSLFVDLHGYSGHCPTDPAEALEGLLRGLGVPGPQIPPELSTRIGLYRTITARRRVLLVLDNARDEAQIRPLLPGGVGCLVLITSRRRLRGLDEADHLSLDTLPADDAGRLFRVVVGPGRDLEDPLVVDQIVRLCGFLPLAIRITATHLKTSVALTGPALLDWLRTTLQDDRPPESGGAGPDRLGVLDDGERSVIAALDMSVQRLPGEQRHALALLGQHPGAEFEPYATAALLDSTPGRARWLLDRLEQVSLLGQPTAGRYRFHDLVRIYVTTRCSPAPAATQAALDRLYGYYAYTASGAMATAYPHGGDERPPAPASQTATPEFSDHAAALAWLNTETANLLATAHHAAAHDRPAHSAHQVATLDRHLRERGALVDAAALHQIALDLARGTADQAAEVTALTRLGNIRASQGQYDSAVAAHTEALNLARATQNTRGQLNALSGLASVYYQSGYYTLVDDYHTQALDLARSTGNNDHERRALNGLGVTHHTRGRYSAATDHHTQALDLAHAAGDSDIEAYALNALGYIHSARQQYETAANYHTRALELARTARNRWHEFDALTGLGILHYKRGHYVDATACHTGVLQVARRIGDIGSELNAMICLANVHRAQGRHGIAGDYYQQVLDIARTVNTRHWQFEAHLGLGHTYHSTNQPDTALTAYQTAYDLARELDLASDQVRALAGLANAYNAIDHQDQARYHWRRALAILNELDIPAAEEVTADDLRAHLDRVP